VKHNNREWCRDIALSGLAGACVALAVRWTFGLTWWETAVFAMLQLAAFIIWWQLDPEDMYERGWLWALVGVTTAVVLGIGIALGWEAPAALIIGLAVPWLGVTVLAWVAFLLLWYGLVSPWLPPLWMNPADPYARLVCRLLDACDKLGHLRNATSEETWLLAVTIPEWLQSSGLLDPAPFSVTTELAEIALADMDSAVAETDSAAWIHDAMAKVDRNMETAFATAKRKTETWEGDRWVNVLREQSAPDQAQKWTRELLASRPYGCVSGEILPIQRCPEPANVERARVAMTAMLDNYRPRRTENASKPWALVHTEEAVPSRDYPGPAWAVTPDIIQNCRGVFERFNPLPRLEEARVALEHGFVPMRGFRSEPPVSPAVRAVVEERSRTVSAWVRDIEASLVIPSPTALAEAQRELAQGVVHACLGEWDKLQGGELMAARRTVKDFLRLWGPRVMVAGVLAVAAILVDEAAAKATLALGVVAVLAGAWQKAGEQVAGTVAPAPRPK
jgi:hypothetical protein